LTRNRNNLQTQSQGPRLLQFSARHEQQAAAVAAGRQLSAAATAATAAAAVAPANVAPDAAHVQHAAAEPGQRQPADPEPVQVELVPQRLWPAAAATTTTTTLAPPDAANALVHPHEPQHAAPAGPAQLPAARDPGAGERRRAAPSPRLAHQHVTVGQQQLAARRPAGRCAARQAVGRAAPSSPTHRHRARLEELLDEHGRRPRSVDEPEQGRQPQLVGGWPAGPSCVHDESTWWHAAG